MESIKITKDTLFFSDDDITAELNIREHEEIKQKLDDAVEYFQTYLSKENIDIIEQDRKRSIDLLDSEIEGKLIEKKRLINQRIKIKRKYNK